MRMIQKQDPQYTEVEITVCYPELTPRLTGLFQQISSFFLQISGKKDGETHNIPLEKVLYFESVEDATFIYTSTDVFDCAARLYELEASFASSACVRVSKSCILNTIHVESVRPLLSGRMEALLSNGEKVNINRRYLADFKSKFNLEDV